MFVNFHLSVQRWSVAFRVDAASEENKAAPRRTFTRA
jgi:hypothetical protein